MSGQASESVSAYLEPEKVKAKARKQAETEEVQEERADPGADDLEKKLLGYLASHGPSKASELAAEFEDKGVGFLETASALEGLISAQVIELRDNGIVAIAEDTRAFAGEG